MTTKQFIENISQNIQANEAHSKQVELPAVTIFEYGNDKLLSFRDYFDSQTVQHLFIENKHA